MLKKRLLFGITAGLLAISCSGCSFTCFMKKETVQVQPEAKKQEEVKPIAEPQALAVQKPVPKKEPNKALYPSTSYNLPLSSIVEISKIPLVMKKTVDEVLEASQGIYFLKYDKDSESAILLLQNPVGENSSYSRHSLEFVQISNDGSKTFHLIDENCDEENENDIWIFDETVDYKRPLKHIAYNEKGNIEYTEAWNYNSETPVKYEMKNSKDKLISIFKETHDNDSNYRKEHVFYDKDGKTALSVSANYEGANITRFTYYNKADEDESLSIMSQYENGNEVSETIYNKDYELQKTIKSDYIDGVRNSITVFDNNNKEIEKIAD